MRNKQSTTWGAIILCLSLCVIKNEGFIPSPSGIRYRTKTNLRDAATTDNRGPKAKVDPDAYTLAILGDLHLDPRHMNDHNAGREHFKALINDKAGQLKPNTCVVSLGDLGESKSVSPETTKELFAG
jgi:hypothetical protein